MGNIEEVNTKINEMGKNDGLQQSKTPSEVTETCQKLKH